MSDAASPPRVQKQLPKRRWLRRALIGLALTLALVAAAPYIAQYPPVRDWLVNALAKRENVRAEVGGASFGWFTPLELRDVRVDSPQGAPLLNVARIRAAKPWWQLALSQKRLGRFFIGAPHVTLLASPSGWNFEGIGPAKEASQRPADPGDRSEPSDKPELTAVLQDAAVVLRRAGIEEPLLDVEGVHATVDIRYLEDTRWLIVQPFQPLDRKQLTPEMCNNGLQLIAPILANATWVSGEVSLSIDEFRLPLDRRAAEDPQLPPAFAAGRLDMHSVETGLKNPLLQEIANKVATLLGSKMPTRVRIANETQVQFELRDRRVYHEGLAFGLPEVSPNLVIRTSGYVGLDKSLDLRVEAPTSLDWAFDGPIAQRLSGKSIELAVTGTLDDPKVSFPEDKGLVQQLANLVSENPEETGGAVAGGMVDLARDVLPLARDATQGVAETLSDALARVRDRRADRRAARNPGALERFDDDSSEALPPAPPREGERPEEGAFDDSRANDDEEVEPNRRRGPLRRLLDRSRRNREE